MKAPPHLPAIIVKRHDNDDNAWVHEKDLIAALERARARTKAAAVRLTPPSSASPASVAAAESSTLAGIGKEVLASGTFPGIEGATPPTAGRSAEGKREPLGFSPGWDRARDAKTKENADAAAAAGTCDKKKMVVIRARTPLDLDKCIRARTEQMNVLSRAKRSRRAVEVDEDEWDDVNNPNVAHLYVTYDDPASRHTLAVARVLLDADRSAPPKAFAAATRLLSTAEARSRSLSRERAGASAGGADADAAAAVADADDCVHPGGGGAGHGATLRACVDRFVATGLSMFPDPVNQPRFVRELLLEGCHEVLRRAGFGGTASTVTATAVNTAEYGLLALGGTLPATARVVSVEDAIHDNEAYIQMVDPNRLGGMVARRALKLYVLKVPGSDGLNGEKKTAVAAAASSSTSTRVSSDEKKRKDVLARASPAAEGGCTAPFAAAEREHVKAQQQQQQGYVTSRLGSSSDTVVGLAERADSDMKLNAAVLTLNAQRAASVVGSPGGGGTRRQTRRTRQTSRSSFMTRRTSRSSRVP